MKLSVLMTAAFCLFTQASMASEYYAVLEDNVMVLKPLEVIYSGDNIFMEANFACDYGSNIYLGENFYANFNTTMLDVCEIRIGNNAMFGPNCQLLTPLHPLNAEERIAGLEFGAPITIGDNVWLGGGVTILPGITLGDNVVVGAGSVVTKSFGDNVVLGGNPARVIKNL